jgi:uncharacterized protein (DUF362 family)
MRKVSRRKFLGLVGVAGAAGVLQACTPKTSPTFSPASTKTPFGAITNTPQSLSTEAPVESPSNTPENTPTNTPPAPDLAVARGGEPVDLARRAVAALGGMSRFVPDGANVVIKPNICVSYRTYEYAATTNPWVVGALVKMAFEAGARSVKVMDSPFGGTAEEAYRMSGIQQEVEAAGGEMVIPASFTLQKVDLPGAVYLKSAKIYEDILNADVLINAPIAKDHGMARLTLSMKNLMGVVQDRPTLHADFGNALTDLNFRIHSTLVVVDAVRILTYGGPQGGDLNAVQKLDTVIASTDVVAADAYASTLFNMQPDELDYVRVGNARGLGRSDINDLSIAEV